MLSHSALIDGFSNAGRLEEAKKLFHEKLDENICPHVVTYSWFIDEVPSENICFNVVMYDALIDGWWKEGKWQEATEVFHEMLDKG